MLWALGLIFGSVTARQIHKVRYTKTGPRSNRILKIFGSLFILGTLVVLGFGFLAHFFYRPGGETRTWFWSEVFGSWIIALAVIVIGIVYKKKPKT